jgi:hypothetical protein
LSFGPTQCGNCQKYGHGSSNCWLKPQCVKWGEEQKSSLCVYNIKDTKRIPDENVKCANCGQLHTANFKNCSKQTEYIKIKEIIRENNIKKRKSGFTVNHQHQNYNNQFPSLNNRFLTEVDSQTHIHSSKPSYSSFYKNTSNDVNPSANDLFSNSECMNILNEFILKLQKCNSKIDQIRAIAKITFKYLSCG